MVIKNVALFGAGAVGAYFIWGLSEKLGDDFCVVAKGERGERLRRNGININGKLYKLNVKEPEEVKAPDLILVSTKYDALENVIPDIKGMIGQQTLVMSVLNGVDSEERIGKIIGMEHMLYSVIRISSARNDDGIAFPPERTLGLFVGEKDCAERTERIRAVEALFEETEIKCTFVSDIIKDMWIKYAGNVSQNLPQAILGVGAGAYVDSEHVSFIAKKLWEEVAIVAKAKGIMIEPELVRFGNIIPTARYSTLQDIDAKRHTEIDMFAGEMVRMGQEVGIPVPYCEYTYHLMRSIEEKNDGKFKYE